MKWFSNLGKPRGHAAMLALLWLVTPALKAATMEEEAVAAAREWVKAVVDRDVDAQMKRLPKRLYPSPDSRERGRRQREHENEMALVNGTKYVLFDILAPSGSGKVGDFTMVVIPYRMVLETRGSKLERTSSLLAIAEEGSSNWSVMDGTGQNPRSLRFVVPGYKGVPRIPVATSKLLEK
jgi:hypothetical protein